MSFRFISAFIALSFSAAVSRAQLVVDSLAINEYVQDVLLGSGIQATNISFTGCLNQIGYMHEGGSVGLGIAGGVVLSTDHVRNIEVPSPFLGIWDGNCQVVGDPDLLSIANSVPPLIGQSFAVGSVNDLSVLEFDFIPTGDTLRFKYIFGSDEYLEWVNSSYNDIFAFLLSGPGISGPYDSPGAFPGGAVNIAKLPGSGIPITISSVNNVTNSAYYVDNVNNENISIDGYTVVLEAWHEVQCGETYHIKLAIADGSDTALESIVILEEGSFASNSVVDVSLEINVGGPEASTIYEDCGEATIVFTRAEVSDLTVEDMVVVTWGGSALMGPDYNQLPDTIIFPVGVSSISFELDAIEDGLNEGSEIVYMDILNLAACNGSGLVSNFEFYIADEPDPLVVEGFDTQICQGAITTLEPTITGGYGNFHYDWSTNESTPTIDVSPLTPTSYYLTVSDTCGMPSADAEFFVDILVFPPLIVNIDGGDLLLNCNEQVNVTATASGGDGVYSYYWYDANDNNLFGWFNSVWYGSWNGAGSVNVEVTDGCGFTATDAVNVALNVPAIIVDVPASIVATCNQLFTVSANVSGGEQPYSYIWTLNGTTDWNEWDSVYDDVVSADGTLSLTVGDNCGQTVTEEIEITIDSPPIDLVLTPQVSGTCATVFTFDPEVSAGSGGFEYTWTENSSTLGNGATLNFSSDVDTQVDLLVEDQCGASATASVIVDIENPALTVDLGADIQASCLDNTELTANVGGGSGGIAFEWLVQGEQEGSGTTFEIQSFETITVVVNVSDFCGETATDEVTIEIPDIPITLITSPDTSVCLYGDALLFAFAEGGEEGFTYSWTNPGSTSNEMVLNNLVSSDIYSVTATDQCGKSLTADISVEVLPVEAFFAAIENGPNYYEFTALTEPECPNCTYFWDFGDGVTSVLPSVIHQFDGLGNYTVTHMATNEIGCTDITYYTVTAPPSIYIPNAFTPNGDGINDALQVIASAVKEFEMHIFNRWGEEVFSSTDPSAVWAGDHHNEKQYYVPDGVYMYIVKVKGYNSDAFEKSGIIVLTR